MNERSLTDLMADLEQERALNAKHKREFIPRRRQEPSQQARQHAMRPFAAFVTVPVYPEPHFDQLGIAVALAARSRLQHLTSRFRAWCRLHGRYSTAALYTGTWVSEANWQHRREIRLFGETRS